MARQSIQRVLEWLGRVITQPHDELTRWQAAVRFAYDLGRYGARQLRRDQAPQMAAALSYRTLFGLLPVIVVGTLVVRAVGGFGDFEEWLASFFSSAGLDGFEIAAAPAGIATDPAGAGDVAATGQTLSEWLLTIVSQTETLNLAAITWVGVAVVIYSALSLVGTIEGCFNAICRAPEGRSWTRRVPIYWTVLTLGPAAIFFAAYAERRFSQFMGDHVSWGWVLRIAPTIWSFGAAWLVMFIAYKLLPNTRVKTPAAAMGALMAAVLLEIGKRTMGAYLSNALSIRQLYGSLGLIPLFMFAGGDREQAAGVRARRSGRGPGGHGSRGRPFRTFRGEHVRRDRQRDRRRRADRPDPAGRSRGAGPAQPRGSGGWWRDAGPSPGANRRPGGHRRGLLPRG